jgi:outer membrane protein insertion porin family
VGIGVSALLMLSLSSAEAVDWYDGLDVGAVSIVNSDGYVPDGDLQNLLLVQVGKPFHTSDTRGDLSTLYTMGEFASISVDLLNNSIDDSPFLLVQYRIEVAPRLIEVDVHGPSRRLQRVLEELLPYSLGQVFYPDVELWKLNQYLVSRLEALGYIDVQLDIEHKQISNQEIHLDVQLLELIDNRYDTISVVNLPNQLDWRYRRLLNKYNLQTGELVKVRELNEFKLDVQELLRRSGWLDSKVRIVLQSTPDAFQELHILIEPQKRVSVTLRNFDGDRRFRSQFTDAVTLRERLDLYSGVLLSEGDIPRMTESLLKWLELEGYWDASVDLQLQESSLEYTVFIDLVLGPRHQISEIVLPNDTNFTSPELLSTLLYERSQLNPGIFFNGVYNQILWNNGLVALKEAFIAAGYLDVSFKTDDQSTLQKDVVLHRLTLSIVQGEQYNIGLVQVVGGIDSVNESVVGDLEGVYKPQRLETVKRELQRSYQSNGFLYTSVDVQSTVTQQQLVDVQYTIDMGDLVLLRNVGIRGNRLTQREVIDDALGLHPGLPLSPSLLEGVRYDLNVLELFDSTSVRLNGETFNQQDLLISVEERPQWALRTGGSVATDLGVLAIGSIHNRNVGGKGRQASMLGQFGYSWTEDAWRFDSTEPIWRLASTYSAPRTPIKMSNVRLESIFQEIVQQPNYRLVQSGVGLGLGMSPNSNINLLIEYRLKRMVLDDVEPSLLVSGEPWSVLSSNDPNDSTDPFRWWSGVQGTMILDYRNDPFNPTEGTVLSGDVKIGDGLINQLPTVRIAGGVTTLVPMGPFRWKIGFNWGIGRTNDDSPLPLEERFFLGGSNSMRGFARNQVGPANNSGWSDFEYPEPINDLIDEYFLSDATDRWIPTGGEYFALANLELHYPLSHWDMTESSLVSFVDIGHVDFISGQSTTTSTSLELDPLFRYCVGIGLRYSTVIGPIAFDVGINPSPIVERGEVWIVPNLSFGSL